MPDSKKYRISLDRVNVAKGNVLSRASMAQIVLIAKRSLPDAEPENDYQKIFYPFLEKTVTELVNKFDELSEYSSETERSVISSQLYTPVGKKDAVGPSFYNRVALTSKINFGPLLNALGLRVKFLIDRETPKRYVDNKEEAEYYKKHKANLEKYYKFVLACKEEYENTVKEARKTEDMEQVAQRRKERREARLAAKEERLAAKKATKNAEKPASDDAKAVRTAAKPSSDDAKAARTAAKPSSDDAKAARTAAKDKKNKEKYNKKKTEKPAPESS